MTTNRPQIGDKSDYRNRQKGLTVGIQAGEKLNKKGPKDFCFKTREKSETKWSYENQIRNRPNLVVFSSQIRVNYMRKNRPKAL